MKGRVAIIGFGEVGSRFARDLDEAGASRILVFDVADAAQARARACAAVTLRENAAAAARDAELVFVAVTAASTLDAIRSLAGGLAHAPLVVDVTSVSPSTRQEAARITAQQGGRYVEAAIMTSVPPRGLRSAMLLGGEHAGAFIDLMHGTGMQLTPFSGEVGKASSVKMCRSIMIKGLEALATECLLSARHYGVEQHVLASLADTLPHEDWPGLARYVIGRALRHGRRRAEEMHEVAHTVEEAGLAPILSDAIAERQDWAFEQGRQLAPGTLETADLPALLDALAALAPGGTRHDSG